MTRIDFKNLRRYRKPGTSSFDDTIALAIPPPKSSSGKTRRRCPNKDCAPRLFLIGTNEVLTDLKNEPDAGIRRRPGTPGCTCPYCGGDGDDNDFITPEDIEYAKETAMAAVKQDLIDHLKDFARDLNRSFDSRKSLLSLSIDVTASPIRPPRAFREDLLRNLQCNACRREYGVFAIGLYCPDCGSKNLGVHFNRELELVAKQIDGAEAKNDEGEREYAYRLLGNAHEDVLTAFEMYQKTVYRYLVKSRKPAGWEKLLSVGNDFQKSWKSIERFKNLGIAPYQSLTEVEIERLNVLAKKRHVIGHNLGVADSMYIEYDQAAKDGQTLHLKATEVEEFAVLCQTIVTELEKHL